jgi:AP-4 complex subunit epsilon-1
LRELLIRAIYVEMLGHDASFAHIHAVNLTQSKNLLVKRIGYLACSLFIDENSEMVILMIATIQRDLASKNHLEVLAALTVLSKLCNQHILMAVNESVQKLLQHAHEMIRKKAVMVLFKMYKTYPQAIDQMDAKMKKALCDKDPQVMAATLNYFADAVKKNPSDYKDLVNSFVVILKQIVEHRLPREYDYHRIPAPWIQMKILEILSYLGADDKTASENMYEIISTVLKRADDSGINIGYALVFQSLKTICMIYPSQSLMDTVTTTISRFLSSESHNLKYIGITGLALIVKIDPKYTLNYQSLVVDCLEDADDTLKIKTLDLLYRMTNKQNVEAIVEKLLSYLKEAPTESSVRKDLVIKINQLCEDYSPNKNWYVRTMNKLYEMGGDLITTDLSNKFIMSISDYEKEIDGEKFRDSTIKIYLKMLKKNPNIPDSMLQVVAWIMGEYGATLPDVEKRTKIINLLVQVAYRPLEDELTRAYILSAITKLHATIGYSDNPNVEAVMYDYSKSKHVDVQQRALEYKVLKDNAARVPKDILMNTPLNEQ